MPRGATRTSLLWGTLWSVWCCLGLVFVCVSGVVHLDAATCALVWPDRHLLCLLLDVHVNGFCWLWACREASWVLGGHLSGQVIDPPAWLWTNPVRNLVAWQLALVTYVPPQQLLETSACHFLFLEFFEDKETGRGVVVRLCTCCYKTHVAHLQITHNYTQEAKQNTK